MRGAIDERLASDRRGLQFETKVGSGGYRIDLAEVDPRDPTRYCLAIECDGATYHSGRSVRDRDMARQQLLETRGWTFERIWNPRLVAKPTGGGWADRGADAELIVRAELPAEDRTRACCRASLRM